MLKNKENIRRIKLNKSGRDCLIDMSNGNQDCFKILSSIYQSHAVEGIQVLKTLDQLHIYGEDLVKFYRDSCGGDLQIMHAKLNDIKAGRLDKTQLFTSPTY